MSIKKQLKIKERKKAAKHHQPTENQLCNGTPQGIFRFRLFYVNKNL
jgi:hypothetical protein